MPGLIGWELIDGKDVMLIANKLTTLSMMILKNERSLNFDLCPFIMIFKIDSTVDCVIVKVLTLKP